ncbi:Uncharacterised protein [Burkholderia gladioli]|nr:Uncharacterised protein [Burkholderia gladioli]
MTGKFWFQVMVRMPSGLSLVSTTTPFTLTEWTT